MVLLELNNLTKYFGGLKAVSDLNLQVNQGEILGLIGPNGAGKSTVFNLINGFLSPTRGKVTFKGENITRFPPHRIAQKGLARVFQGNILFQNFTSMENLLIAFHLHTNIGYWESFLAKNSTRVKEKAFRKKAMDLLEFVGLSQHADEIASSLPHGYQRRLGVAIALAVEPDLLALDEPVTGMNAEEILAMESMIRTIRDEKGITSIIVEHNMRTVMGLCDRIAVLSYGKKIADGSPKEIAEHPDVISAYLGEEQDVAAG